MTRGKAALSDAFDLAVVIPANNEETWIARCLRAVLASHGPEHAQVIVVANGCTDNTAEIARGMTSDFAARGWALVVLELMQGGKIAALNAGDGWVTAPVMAYLDADVVVGPEVLGQLAKTLRGEAPAYGSGTLHIPKPQSTLSQAYLRIYRQVPFITTGVPGCGLFAMNAAGRARWDKWPDIISDDTFARLQFTPQERHKVPGMYEWPIVEGWTALVRVRRRQNVGVTEVHERYPTLARNDDKPALGRGAMTAMALRDPLGFAAYAGVALATKLGGDTTWSRGR